MQSMFYNAPVMFISLQLPQLQCLALLISAFSLELRLLGSQIVPQKLILIIREQEDEGTQQL